MAPFHLASHVTVSTWTTSPQLCFLPSPMSGTGGTFARFPMLIVMSCGGSDGSEDCARELRRIARGNAPNCAAHLGEDARLELPHLRVLAAAAEEAGRLDAEVAHLRRRGGG